MSELDDLYARIREAWLEEPEKLEKDQPLLARALREAQPNRDLEYALECKNREVESERRHLAVTRERTNRERVDREQRIGQLAGELAKIQRESAKEIARLTGVVERLRKERKERIGSVTTLAEQAGLAEFGWRKSA